VSCAGVLDKVETDMDWNVVVTGYDWRGLRSARRLLSRYGEVARTHFHNVLVLRVADVRAFLEAISRGCRA
jgi:hypothetical protein